MACNNGVKLLILIFIIMLSLPVLAESVTKKSIARSLQAQENEVGKVTLQFSASKDKDYQNIATVLEKRGYIQEVVDEVNKKFIVPFNIPIVFEDSKGPVYDTGAKQITMSYDFVLYLSSLFIKDYPDAKSQSFIEFAEDSTVFFLYHELAHALIDVYKIPIASSEETAADNLAIIIALEYTKNGYNIVMNTANLFDMLDRANDKYDPDELWDEHALDSQRFYNILCLTYGKYPGRVMKELMQSKNKNLTKFVRERSDYCQDYYKQQYNAWRELLDIHLTP